MAGYLGEATTPDKFVGMDLTDPPLDFAAIARAFGVHAERVEDPADLSGALQRALALDAPALVEVIIDGSL